MAFPILNMIQGKMQEIRATLNATAAAFRAGRYDESYQKAQDLEDLAFELKDYLNQKSAVEKS